MTLWSFRGLSFAVTMDGPIFDEWFAASQLHTVDAVLGGTLRYVDVGGLDVHPLSLTMQFDSTANRLTMQGYRGTTGTLLDDTTRSVTALLADVTPIRVKSSASGIYRLSAVFEFVS